MKRIFLMSAFFIPLQMEGLWQSLEYSGIARHQSVTFGKEGLRIKVNKSAMPLIYPISPSRIVKSISVKGYAHSLPVLNKSLQGSEGNDDYLVRVGLVIKGEKRLSWLKKKLSPKWVKTLFSLAPENTGIDKIEFFNVYQDLRLKGKLKIHPLADGLMQEHNVLYFNETGEFYFKKVFDASKDVLAVWLSVDGDDSKSKFQVSIREIRLD